MLTRPLLAIAALLTTVLMSPPAEAATMYPSGVGADLGPTPTTLGVKPGAGDDPAGLLTGTDQGKGYWRTNQSAGTGYLEFDVDGDYVEEIPADDVLVTVTYLDAGTGSIHLQYDAKADPRADGGTIQRTGTGGWRTGTFALADVAFTNRLGDADLRLSGSADITVAGLRISTAGASVDLGRSPVQAGITARAGDRPENLVTGVEAGRPYWQTDRTAPAPGTNFFYLNVSDTYLYDNRGLVLVSVDYFDQGNGSFGLHYDSPGSTIPDMFKSSDLVRYGDTRTWKTHTFALPDAILTNRSNGSDFRIHNGDGAVDLKVAAVRVAKVAGALDVTEGLVDLIEEAARSHRAAREGSRDGQYPVGSRATLQSSIDDARAVAEKPGVTDTEVKAALRTLQAKLDAFTASVVDTSFAQEAAASASDGTDPAAVNDKDQTTEWAGSGWVQLRLDKERPVNDVRIDWGTGFSPDYTVQLSTDGRRFTTAGRNGASAGNQLTRTRFATAKTRYVRVVPTGAEKYGIREIQLRHAPVVKPEPRLVPTLNPTEDLVVADFDATRFGADRTGRTDSAKAIQRAIYACQDAGGGTVWLPAGRYRVTTTIEVHAFCTLRGDRRDPDRDRNRTDYGTVVVADLPAGDEGPTLFRIGGSAGVIGVTTYYPRQSATAPIPYNHTFEIPGNAWIGNENYMMATISDVTMLNSYRGIGLSTYANDRGGAPGSSQVHESTTIRNVRGTVLFEGARAYNGADVGTWENLMFSNSYWANAPAEYQPPNRAVLDRWTRANGTGLVLGDLEWDQFHRITLSDYKVGINVVAGQRAQFTGSFLEPDIRRTDIAVKVDVIDDRWGMTLAGGRIEGSDQAVRNDARGYVKITGTTVTGRVSGIVHRMTGTVPTYQPKPLPTPKRALYVADAPHGIGYLPAVDATPAIQRTLDRAGRAGGGIVYLPAGWYRISTHLRVPGGVELRGSSPVPNRDQAGASAGTVLHAFEGRKTAAPDTATALVTLDGARAGLRGLRVFYPENNPASSEGLVPYPYAVRGNGAGTYVINAGFPNAWNGVDLARHRNDGFTVRKLAGAFFDHAIHVGASAHGRVEGVLSNGNAVTRIGYQPPHWMTEGRIFELVIDKVMRANATIVTVDGATELALLNVFGYGFHDGLVVNSGRVDGWNLGTDNLGADGYTVKVAAGDVAVTNLARYNGATSTGPVVLRNVMVINVVQRSVSVAAAGNGTVAIHGNESEPGRYEVGARVTVTAAPGSDSVFRHWSVNGEVISTEPEHSFAVTTDQVLTATFDPTG